MNEETLKHCDEMLQDKWEEEYQYAGSFQTALMRTIELADHINLVKIETIYPNMVKAFITWQKGY